MSAHVLLNLLNELRKRDKIRGLPSITRVHSGWGAIANPYTKVFDSPQVPSGGITLATA